MKAGIVLLFLVVSMQLAAQKDCSSSPYQQEQFLKDPSFLQRVRLIEEKVQRETDHRSLESRTGYSVIRIPVVVHVLYHYPGEKVNDEKIFSQIEMLNKCFRRRNADTVNTPAVFKPFAADTEIEFQLAKSDPLRRSTNGIVRRYTPITSWKADDKVKFSAEMGSDAWDTRSYLNIWVCNLDRLAGYSTFPGANAAVDGIVLDFDAFGASGNTGYEMGKTAVHEVGHWLGLKHLWGDANCGDDGVDDTPKQAAYTPGCPKGIRITCGNGPNGDMYMNYMDFTSDACMNLFTKGQKARMQAHFANGGARYSILSSTGLNTPLIFNSPVEEMDPKWLHPRMYPNPATRELNIDLNYDPRWIGKILVITDLRGQTIMNLTISSKLQKIDISRLPAGTYILAAKKEDGESIREKFIKL